MSHTNTAFNTDIFTLGNLAELSPRAMCDTKPAICRKFEAAVFRAVFPCSPMLKAASAPLLLELASFSRTELFFGAMSYTDTILF
jgi:hypothetical protein